METRDNAVAFEPDAGAGAFDDFATDRDQQGFNGVPFDRRRNWVGENRREGFLLSSVHTRS